MPSRSPGPRWALTPPFHPCPASPKAGRGGLLSVALSLVSPPAGVTRRLVAVEPGLSSPAGRPARAAARPSGPPARWGRSQARSSGARQLLQRGRRRTLVEAAPDRVGALP